MGSRGQGSLAGLFPKAAPLRGSFSLEKRKTGAEPIAAIRHDDDIPGRNRSRIQLKFALTPDLRCRAANSTDVPIKIDFPDHMDLNVDKIDTQL